MGTQKDSYRSVLVELKCSDAVVASALTFDSTAAPTPNPDLLSGITGLTMDSSYGTIELPSLTDPATGRGDEDGIDEFDPYDLSLGREVNKDHAASTFLVRATLDAEDLTDVEELCKTDSRVKAIYSDPVIQICDWGAENHVDPMVAPGRICPGSPPLGTDRHVAARLGVPWLQRRRMDGRGVFLAIVDTGINLAYLRSRGRMPRLDTARSWMARPTDLPGRLPVGHGTMVAYDATIAAPRATLLDIALLRSTRSGGSIMDGLLSDAVRAYGHLYRIMRGPHRPGAFSSLVVNNSWGIFRDSWDFPRSHPGRYLDNNRHPFNRIVGVLAQAGADIVFAAGNCGRECPDGRCDLRTSPGILGANSHPQVISVGAVDVLKRRVGYSTSGPGRLQFMKPDICGYTHFRGSGVYPADGGTSAAAPVVAGLIAAFRSRFQFDATDFRTAPAAIRNMLRRTAEDRGSIGFDFNFGWGIVNGRRLALVRSLSVTHAEEESAPSIDEFTDVEAMLDRIEGLEEVAPSADEIELMQAPVAALPEEFEEIPDAQELEEPEKLEEPETPETFTKEEEATAIPESEPVSIA